MDNREDVKKSIELLEQTGDAHAVFNDGAELVYRHTLLLHRVAIAQGNGVVGKGIAIDGDTEGSTDGILTAVTLADRVLGLDMCVEVELQVVDNLLCLLGQSVLVDQGQHGTLDGSQWLGQLPFSSCSSV